jgi:hypothetical protein
MPTRCKHFEAHGFDAAGHCHHYGGWRWLLVFRSLRTSIGFVVLFWSGFLCFVNHHTSEPFPYANETGPRPSRWSLVPPNQGTNVGARLAFFSQFLITNKSNSSRPNLPFPWPRRGLRNRGKGKEQRGHVAPSVYQAHPSARVDDKKNRQNKNRSAHDSMR